MGRITLEQAAKWCGGQVSPKYKDVVFFGANNDTRKLKEGQLFVALQGARDGHDFIPWFVVTLDKQDRFEMLIYGKNYIDLSPGYSFRRNGHAKSTELLDICRHAGEIMVFRLTTDLETWRLQADRRDSREGMIENTEDQNREIAKKNIERYKKIVAQNRANKDKDFEEIDKQVESIIMRVLKASQISHRNPEKISAYEVSRLNEWIYDEIRYSSSTHKSYGKTGLLRLYNKFTDYLADVKKGDAYDFQIEGLQKVKVQILDTIKKIDEELKALGL